MTANYNVRTKEDDNLDVLIRTMEIIWLCLPLVFCIFYVHSANFCSGLEHKNILVCLLDNFRDLTYLPGSAVSIEPKEVRKFSTQLLEYALKKYRPQLLDTGNMAEGVLALSRESAGVGLSTLFFEPEQDLMAVIQINSFYSEINNLKLAEIPDNPCFVKLTIHDVKFTSHSIDICDPTTKERVLSPYQLLLLVKDKI